MVTSRYLAATAAELPGIAPGNEKLAFMACHFSPYGPGLSNIPAVLPAGSMLMLNDRIPICGHDAQLITRQLREALEKLGCDSLLLDFERPGNDETAQLCRFLTRELSCTLGISHHYANALDCCVFLPPQPLDMPLREHLRPWDGRKIWLEIGLDAAEFTVTAEGCTVTSLPYGQPLDKTFVEESLHCRYRCELTGDAVHFSLYRTADQLDGLLEEAGNLGIEKAIGLYQQLGMKKPLVG